MSNNSVGETAAPTTRLVFDAPAPAAKSTQAAAAAATIDDDEIPQFLRKDHAPAVKPAAQKAPVQEPAKQVDGIKAPSTAAGASIIPPAVGAAIESPTQSPPAVKTSAKKPSLDEMTVDELKRQQEEIDRRIHEKVEAEKRAVIEQIVDIVKTYDITVEEVVDALGGMKIKRKGVKAKPKYRDPETGTLWSGRGKEPAWIKGKDRTPFLIKDPDNGDDENTDD